MIRSILDGPHQVMPKGPNDLLLTPIQVIRACTIDRLGCCIDTPAGNIRQGLYRDNGDMPDGGVLIVEGGPQAAVVNKNEIPIANTVLTPGLYWLALINDNGGCLFVVDNYMQAGGTLFDRVFWGAFGPLPNPCPVTVADLSPIGYLRVLSTP